MSNLSFLADPEYWRTVRETAPRSLGALAQGLTSGIVGAPVDVANMALTPFGLGSERPIGGSNHLGALMNARTESTPYQIGTMLPVSPADMAQGLPVMAGIFVGKQAKNAKLADLLKAEEIAKKGIPDPQIGQKSSIDFSKLSGKSVDEQADALERWAKENDIDLTRKGSSNKSNSLYYEVKKPTEYDPEYGLMDWDTAHIRIGSHPNQTNTEDYLNAVKHYNIFPSGGDDMGYVADDILEWLKDSAK